MNIINDKPVMIFKKEEDNKTRYTVGLSNKKQDGTYENAYFPIQFNKGVVLENQTRIMLVKAWLSFYSWEYQEKKGTTFFIKCSEFTTLEDIQTVPKEKVPSDTEIYFDDDVKLDEIVLTDDDLPF